jgi:SH3 domain-containing protein
MVIERGTTPPEQPESDVTLPPKWSRARVTRCEECGAKAILAASTCPQCGHDLELRNSFGEPVPLAHCPTCDSFYPKKRGECRWCGTPAPKREMAPLIWRTLGVLAVAGMAVVIWQANTGDHSSRTITRAAASESTVVVAADPTVMSRPIARDSAAAEPLTRDTVTIASSGVVAPNDSSAGAPSPSPVAAPIVPVADAPAEKSVAPPVPNVSPRVSGTPLSAAPPIARSTPAPSTSRGAPPVAATRGRPATPPGTGALASAPSRPPKGARWITTTVRNWVSVRADARPEARIVAAIGPDTRVQLGESRAGWLRVRARGISGWVERRRLYADARLGR